MLMVISSSIIIVIVFIVIRGALSVKINKRSAIVSIFSLATIYVFVSFILPEQISSVVMTSIIIIFASVAPLPVFQYKYKSQIFYLSMLALGVISTVAGTISWISELDLTDRINAQVIDLIANTILLLFCVILAKRKIIFLLYRSITILENHMKIMLLITIWLSAVSTMLFSFFLNLYADLPGFVFIGVTLATYIILVGVMCPLLILNTISKAHFKNLSDAMDRQIDAQVVHYEAMARMHEDIQQFQHDYRNLHIGLQSALMRNDIEGALSYLESDEMSLRKLSHTYETGNVVLDALLREKQSIASENNTTIVFDGEVPGNLLSAADICILFGNALDNAIEACAKLTDFEEKVISVISSLSRRFLFIEIKNPVKENVQINNNSINTTKADKNAHGIGLRSIQATAKKYSGTTRLSCDDNTFCIEIDLDFNLADIERQH